MLLEENENVFLLKTEILLNLREQHTLLVSLFLAFFDAQIWLFKFEAT